MAFQFSESHIEEYERNGFTVFRGILPSSLIDDLRRVCDLGATIAREKSGGQSQRFQPVSSLEIDQQPFRDYSELPVLRDAVARVLTPTHAHGDLDLLGVLIEPAADAYCTQWHRDWRDNVPSTDIAEFEKLSGNKLYFGQVNCALYEDSCTWFVPGSHARLDTPEEAALFPERPWR